MLQQSGNQSGPSSVGGHASKQARGSTTPMGPLFAASYPARLFNTAEVLSLARSAGLDVLQPAYQNFVSSLSSFEKTVPKELVKPQVDAPRNVNQPLALLAAAATTATGSEAVLPTEYLRLALPLKTVAVEEADDYPGAPSVVMGISQRSFNTVLCVSESGRIVAAVPFTPQEEFTE